MATVTDEKPKIPTEYLPADYKAQGAELFALKEETIRKIVNGELKNPTVFKHFLDIAVAEKKLRDEKLNFLHS